MGTVTKATGWRGVPALLIGAIFACPAAASEPDTAAEVAAEVTVQGVPSVPVVADINGLDRVELRREIGRAEGRISDLRKEHEAAMRGFAKAADLLADQTSDQTSDRAGEQAPDRRPDAPETEDSPEDRRADIADGRRQAEALFQRDMAAARYRLDQLLDRQALIDPAAMDQTRLRPAPASAPATAETNRR